MQANNSYPRKPQENRHVKIGIQPAFVNPAFEHRKVRLSGLFGKGEKIGIREVINTCYRSDP